MNQSEETFRVLEGIPAIRLRPAMYVGNTHFYGFIHYLVGAVALLLSLRPKRIAVSARQGGFHIESDVAVPIGESTDGKLSPFEATMKVGLSPGLGIEGVVLNALSQSLSVEILQGGRREVFEYRRGTRLSHAISKVDPNGSCTILRFVPDSSILTITAISPAIFTSYLRRLSFLYPGVHFSHTAGPETQKFHAEKGIVDMFAGVSAPYQLLHEPVHIIVEEGFARLEAVFAYHSWTENIVWCFINNFRAVEGGTHEQGFLDAINQLVDKLELPKDPEHDQNGVVGIMSLQYPGAEWNCIGSRIVNPELRDLVCNWVVRHTMEWIRTRPDVAEQLRSVRTCDFPKVWHVSGEWQLPQR